MKKTNLLKKFRKALFAEHKMIEVLANTLILIVEPAEKKAAPQVSKSQLKLFD